MRIVLAITGASGMAYALRLLDLLRTKEVEVHLLISQPACNILAEEAGRCVNLDDFRVPDLLDADMPNLRFFRSDDFTAPCASGSACYDAMVVVPCSMGTLGRIASGASTDLISRAADVFLKERRKLILVPRETPLSLIHLRNMGTVTEAGAIVLPACPGFYHKPTTVADLVDFIVARLLDHLGIEHDLVPRWGERDQG